MNESRRILLGTLGWLGAISGLHAWLNVDWAAVLNDTLPEGKRKLNVAYIPVT
jgi:NitT/TauT family transport system substrate-binding protein